MGRILALFSRKSKAVQKIADQFAANAHKMTDAIVICEIKVKGQPAVAIHSTPMTQEKLAQMSMLLNKYIWKAKDVGQDNPRNPG
jgi:hypothetical protein